MGCTRNRLRSCGGDGWPPPAVALNDARAESATGARALVLRAGTRSESTSRRAWGRRLRRTPTRIHSGRACRGGRLRRPSRSTSGAEGHVPSSCPPCLLRTPHRNYPIRGWVRARSLRRAPTCRESRLRCIQGASGARFEFEQSKPATLQSFWDRTSYAMACRRR